MASCSTCTSRRSDTPTPWRRLAGALLAAGLAAGCGPSSQRLREEIARDGAGTFVAGVPFVRQRGAWCGPAALASIAQHYGLELSQDEIAREAYLPSIRATLTIDLQQCAARHGLWCHAGPGTPEDVRTWLDRGVPVVALLRRATLAGGGCHFIVVTAYHRERGYFLAHVGSAPSRPISFARFARESGRAGGWLLVACPPERVAWPLTAEGHNDLGVQFERAGALERARREYERAIALDPSTALFHFNLGNALAGLGEKGAAEQACREAIRREPDHADARNNLACVLLDLGRPEEARREAEQAAAAGGHRSACYLETLGRAWLALGRHAEAAGAFRQAMEKASGDPEIASLARLGLIEALARGGEREKAIAEKDRFLADTKDPALRQRAEALLK